MGNDWVSDVTGGESNSEDNNSSTLFEDNLRRMVEDGNVESLNPQTIQKQIDQVSDETLLEQAKKQDSRDETEGVYGDRLDTLDDTDSVAEAETESDEESSGFADSIEGAQDASEEAESDSGSEGSDGSDEAEETEQESQGESSTAPEEDSEETDGSDTTDESETVEETDEDDTDVSEQDEADESDGVDDETVPTGKQVEEVTEESDGSDDLPDVDVTGIAPDATVRSAAAEADPERSLLIWGQEGTGKTHVAHSAPQPVAYIDTEGKADDIAEKFDKKVYYFQPDDYQDAVEALEQAFDLLAEYREAGVTGTIVVDSITKMWEWAKEDYQELAYPSADDPSEVDFKSALQGEDDWAQIKRRHNKNFRDRIIESPYHTVFTAMAKEDYNAVLEGADGKPMMPDGEKQNPYVVKDVVRLRTDSNGKTVADLHKAAKTRYSFVGLEWPEFDDIYDAIEMVADAETSEGQVDVTQWPFGIVEGRPTMAPTDGSDEDDGN